MYKPEPKPITPEAKSLAAQEAAHASSRGDRETVKEITSIVADSIVDRADFANDTLNADAETIGNSGRHWPFL